METLRAGDGYLTQSTKWVHFGVGQAERIKQLRIRWPGESGWEEFDEIETNARYQVTQGMSNVRRLDSVGGRTPLAATEPRLPPTTDEARVVLTARVPFPITEYLGFDGKNKFLRDGLVGPVLLTFWASWCEPCLRELQDFSKHLEAFEEASVAIVPLCTDQLTEPTGASSATAQELLREIGRFSAGGVATADGVAQLTELQSWIFYKHRYAALTRWI